MREAGRRWGMGDRAQVGNLPCLATYGHHKMGTDEQALSQPNIDGAPLSRAHGRTGE